MKVQVKESLPNTFNGFYGTEIRKPGDKFEIKVVVETDKDGVPILENGKPVIISTEEDQFSKAWMARIDEPKKPIKINK